MRLKIVFQLLLANLLIVAGAHAAAHTQVQLFLSADTAKPGETILAGIDLQMEPGWHTYWKNPGEAGQATEIKWTLPAGITAGEIQWPLPKKLPPAEVTTYGYEDEVMLIVPLTLATNLPAGVLNLTAKVSWLECNESCIPANQDVEAKLNVGSEAKISVDARQIALWKDRIPEKNSYPDVGINFPFQAWWEKSSTGDTRPLIIELPHFAHPKWLKLTVEKADFFPDASDQFELQAATEEIQNTNAEFCLRKIVKKYSGDWPKNISGVVVLQKGDFRQGVDVQLPINDQAPTNEIISAAPISSPIPPSQPLWQMLIYAFIGGLILNIMPCVLPVIALKILGFVNEAKSSPRHVRMLGLVYALGVLVSFLVLAAVVIGVKVAGHKAGWGMQFGNPIFLVCLVTLVTLVAMNLFGFFEVTLGGRALDAAGEISAKPGTIGAFFNGVLATALATPCTAPFLSIALGFAFAQNAAVILLVFTMVGVGLASPYVLLSWNPAWLKFLPKPGAWMEKFKMAMAFPMLLTVVWLFNLAAENYGDRVLWLGVFLVMVALAMWIFGEFIQRGRGDKTFATVIVLVLLVSAYAFALEGELRWREPLTTGKTNGLAHNPDGIAWEAWSPEALMQARATGRPVLVDFTADWCLTCQVNKRTSIEVASVREKIKALNAITLLADYTHFPDTITSELNRFNRAGVPLVLVYPKNPNANAIVLPEVLTPNIVLSALDRAAN